MSFDLSKIPLFRSLSSADCKQIAAGFGEVSFKEKQPVFKQGDFGDSFYVILEGQANVMVKPSNFIKIGDEVTLVEDQTFGGKKAPKGSIGVVDKYDASRDYPYTVHITKTGQRGRVTSEEIEPTKGAIDSKFVAKLKAGDYFGEQSLLKGSRRNASIIASSALKCAFLDSKKFEKLQLGEKLSFAKRKAVQTFDEEVDTKNRNFEKTNEEKELIKKAILRNEKLKEIMTLTRDQLEQLTASAYTKKVDAGDTIIEQGDMQANEFYIVKSGAYQVSVAQTNKHSFNEKLNTAHVVGTIKSGSSFGELALLYQAPRAATVICEESGTLFVVHRTDFKKILRSASEGRLKAFIKILDSIQLFDCLLSEEKVSLANALVEVGYIKGETIIKEGEQGDAFYILAKGEVSFTKNGKQVSTMNTAKPEKGQGSFFGERSLLKKEPRAATATVVSDDAIVLALTKSQFEQELGPLEDLIKEAEKGKRKSKAGKESKTRQLEKITLKDLRKIGLLGCGGFGAVSLEQHKETGKTYALKMLSKGFIVKTKMQQSVMREKEILQLCDSDFVIKLSATFKDKDHLYLLLEPALGGELYATYHKYRFHGDVKKAKYYAGSVVFCFDHLHSKNILYRDLKPENLLLDDKGNCKITDMGLAKIVNGKTYTTCGTPDYFAPEVIQQNGSTKGVDWWTLGILIHELMSGHAPFESGDPMETYRKIVRGVSRVKFTYKDVDAVDVVKNLLTHQAAMRLCMRNGGSNNIKTHKWFSGFNWDDLAGRHMTPPYKPQVKSPSDIANFKCSEADIPPQIPYKDDGSNWDKDF